MKDKKRHPAEVLIFKRGPVPAPDPESSNSTAPANPTQGESPEFQELMDRYLELADSALQPTQAEDQEAQPRPRRHIHFKAN